MNPRKVARNRASGKAPRRLRRPPLLQAVLRDPEAKAKGAAAAKPPRHDDVAGEWTTVSKKESQPFELRSQD